MATNPTDIAPAEEDQSNTLWSQFTHLVRTHWTPSVILVVATLGPMWLDRVWVNGAEFGYTVAVILAIGMFVSHLVQSRSEKQADKVSRGTKKEIEDVKSEVAGIKEDMGKIIHLLEQQKVGTPGTNGHAAAAGPATPAPQTPSAPSPEPAPEPVPPATAAQTENQDDANPAARPPEFRVGKAMWGSAEVVVTGQFTPSKGPNKNVTMVNFYQVGHENVRGSAPLEQIVYIDEPADTTT